MSPRRLLSLCALVFAAACGPVDGSGAGGGTATGGGAGGGGGSLADAGATTLPPGPAIAADAGVWTWVDFPDSQCGNGAPTGLALNPSPGGSTDVVLYLQGGGACWDAPSCFGYNGQGGSAAHLVDGYTGATFAGEHPTGQSFFDRALAGNPFAAASLVFIPYCTGDVHAGDSVQLYPGAAAPVHHHGARNLEAYLARLRTTFPSATRVFLTGSSAGAFGAQLDYPRVAAAFPSAEVHVLADSGQMINPSGLLLSTWLAAWSFAVPADCTGCTADFSKFPAYQATRYPARRFALLAYTQDLVLSFFFARLDGSFETQTDALLATAYDGHPNAHYFVLAGSDHTMLGSVSTLTAPGGPALLTWLARWASGDPAWASVKP